MTQMCSPRTNHLCFRLVLATLGLACQVAKIPPKDSKDFATRPGVRVRVRVCGGTGVDGRVNPAKFEHRVAWEERGPAAPGTPAALHTPPCAGLTGSLCSADLGCHLYTGAQLPHGGGRIP